MREADAVVAADRGEGVGLEVGGAEAVGEDFEGILGSVWAVVWK